MKRVLVATSNPGKLRDFAGAAVSHGIEICALAGFGSLPAVVEDGLTFEENAQKKAESYSKFATGDLVLADDSGLEVDALGGAPGVHSARYAAEDFHKPGNNTDDQANNIKLLRALQNVPPERRQARFVCVLAAAQNGKLLASFRGTAEGIILRAAKGQNGFGYDPLFYFSRIGKTFAELDPQEKAQYSHRGEAFRKFLSWHDSRKET
jgi:XTP/dITP diphosphohydrolase